MRRTINGSGPFNPSLWTNPEMLMRSAEGTARRQVGQADEWSEDGAVLLFQGYEHPA